MHINHNSYITELSWEAARQPVSAANPTLAALIDKLNPSSELTLLKIAYPYGQTIFEKGVMKIPNHLQKFVNLTDASIPMLVQKLLGYSPIPVSVVAKNTVEIYLEPPGRLVPLALLTVGNVLGIWETLDSHMAHLFTPVWNAVAGGRSVFFLPKISEATGHSRLQRTFGIENFVPNNLRDQWHLFKVLANHPDFPLVWECEMLFFTAQWFDKKHHNTAWLELYTYIFQTAGHHSQPWRNKMHFELIWEGFALDSFSRNLKPKAYPMDTLKHFIYIGSGIFPGFIPAGTSDEVAPCTTLQQIYLDVYNIKKYYPTMMHLHHLQLIPGKAERVYYSLQLPTITDYPQTLRKPASAMSELRDIKQLMMTLQHDCIVDNQYFASLISKLSCEYYHNDIDPFDDAQNSYEILKRDQRFMPSSKTQQSHEFAATGTFLRGCVAISRGE